MNDKFLRHVQCQEIQPTFEDIKSSSQHNPKQRTNTRQFKFVQHRCVDVKAVRVQCDEGYDVADQGALEWQAKEAENCDGDEEVMNRWFHNHNEIEPEIDVIHETLQEEIVKLNVELQSHRGSIKHLQETSQFSHDDFREVHEVMPWSLAVIHDEEEHDTKHHIQQHEPIPRMIFA